MCLELGHHGLSEDADEEGRGTSSATPLSPGGQQRTMASKPEAVWGATRFPRTVFLADLGKKWWRASRVSLLVLLRGRLRRACPSFPYDTHAKPPPGRAIRRGQKAYFAGVQLHKLRGGRAELARRASGRCWSCSIRPRRKPSCFFRDAVPLSGRSSPCAAPDLHEGHCRTVW